MKREGTRVFWAILAVKLFVLAVGTMASHHFINGWYHWDAVRYLAIAKQGYVAHGDGVENIAFFPLFPYSIGAVARLVGHARFAGFIVAHVFSVAGFFLFYTLARLELGGNAARRSLWALLLFPTAYFFHLPYTEGLFLLCAAGSFYAARQKRWGWAGVAGAGAVLTRITGLCLFPALLVEFWLQRRERAVSWKEPLWLLLLPLAFGVYLFMCYRVTGDYFSYTYHLENFWHKSPTWPWVGLNRTLLKTFTLPRDGYWFNVGLMEAAAAGFLIVGTIRSFKKDRLSYAVFSAGVALLCLSTAFLLSTPRYALGAFPLFFLHPPLDRPSRWTLVAAIVMVVLMGVYTVRFVQGWWAF